MGRAHEVRAAAMAKTAAYKSKLYSIYAKEIYQAAKANPDPVSNDALRRVIEKAKKEQVPADVINRNIEKAKKGSTEDYQAIFYEAYGPEGSSLIVKALTDNNNRTISEVKTAFNKCGGKMAEKGAVSFMYDNLCAVGVKDVDEEEIMDVLFENELDVKDIEVDGDVTIIYSEPTNLTKIKQVLEEIKPGINFEIDEIGWYAKDMVTLSDERKEQFKRLLSMLNDLEDVSNVYHNVNL